MSIVKSFSVGDGDMFYIKHGSDNFSIIDCYLPEDNKRNIIAEIIKEKSGKSITRFISTHPDQDHLRGLTCLDDQLQLLNFYCIHNAICKEEDTVDFQKYCELRDSDKAFYLKRGCSRKWMNVSDDERTAAGLHILWPIVDNEHYLDALKKAEEGGSPNNASIILKYSLNNGPTILWMGDLETDFMEKIQSAISMEPADIIFAPHHGRATGKIPDDWLETIEPKIVIIGEAPSKDIDYCYECNTITQNSAGDITFDCGVGKTHIYVSNEDYSVNFLVNENKPNTYGKYIGTLSH